MTTAELRTAILRGDFDADLTAIRDSIRDREKIARTIQAQTLKATLVKDQQVRLTAIRPAYLVGQIAKVVSVDRGGNRIMVSLIQPVGKYGTTPISCPANCMEPV